MKNGLGLMLLRTLIGRAWWLFVLFLLATTAAVKAGDFTYTTNSDNTLAITGYTGPGGAVVIPSTIDGKTVTSIGTNAFLGCARLTSVTIPSNVVSIEYAAFEFCTNLTSVMIPNSVTSIGYSAFDECASLTSVMIPNSVISIGYFAFSLCSSMTAITVDAENSVYSSVDGALFSKRQTTLIQYPAGKADSSYTIPNSVANIEIGAFIYCLNLTSITIPNSVNSIGTHAFLHCTNLMGVYFEGNAPFAGLGNAFDNDYNVIVYYLPGTTGWGSTFCGRPVMLWNRNALIKANGATGNITVNHPDPVSVTVAMNAGNYAGVPVDWWVVARAGSSWYYLNRSGEWILEDNWHKWHPVDQGGLGNMPATEVLNISGLGTGSYTFYFAVSYPMTGILNLNGEMLVDSVHVTVQ